MSEMSRAGLAADGVFDDPEYRVEGALKVTGGARYVADVRLPGMLHAKFAKSPHPHARIVSIDASAARKMSGVHAVLTGQDIGPRRFGKVLYDWPVLAYERVRFVGEHVAAVAAETPEIAEEAAARIVVEYDELPAVFDSEEALGPDAPILHPDPSDYYYSAGKRPAIPHPNVQGYKLMEHGDGDIQRVFAEADHVFEDVYWGARQHQGYIEPHGCAVWIDEAGLVHVYSTNKAPYSLHQAMARVTGVPAERIVVDCMFIGGDFGGKGLSIDDFACYYLAQAAGRPVKSIMTYAEELGAANPRHGAKIYMRTAVANDGRMLAHECRTYYHDGAYAAGRPLVGPILDGWSGLEPYKVPNVRLETYVVYTNTVPGGQMRAPGAMFTGFAGECHVDHIARRLGMDPIEFRIKNAVRPGDAGGTGELTRNPRAVEVLETLRRETRWSQQPLAPHRGRGISLRSRDVGGGTGGILMRLTANGQIEAISGAPDQGGGSATAVRRIASAVLSVPRERITMRYGTTAEAPANPGPGGSRLTHVLGQAAIAGATALKERLEELAAEVMGWPAGEVRLHDDRFVVGDGSAESAPFEDVARRIASGAPVEVEGEYDSTEHRTAEGPDANFCAYMVEVDVDPETGVVKPTEVVLVVDVGTVINPIAHMGQLEGGFIFGLGNALMEEVVIEDGRVTTLNLGEYKLPTQMDVPALRTVLLPPSDGPGPFGAKAAGETVNNAVAAAVANAVASATGVRVDDCPITAERVLAAMRKARGG
jgi:CO/xanthine dehydrogenase Mo-binding subunit